MCRGQGEEERRRTGNNADRRRCCQSWRSCCVSREGSPVSAGEVVNWPSSVATSAEHKWSSVSRPVSLSTRSDARARATRPRPKRGARLIVLCTARGDSQEQPRRPERPRPATRRHRARSSAPPLRLAHAASSDRHVLLRAGAPQYACIRHASPTLRGAVSTCRSKTFGAPMEWCDAWSDDSDSDSDGALWRWPEREQ